MGSGNRAAFGISIPENPYPKPVHDDRQEFGTPGDRDMIAIGQDEEQSVPVQAASEQVAGTCEPLTKRSIVVSRVVVLVPH